MAARRFDTLARRLGTTTSRRSALGAVAASGIFGALGLHDRFSPAQAANNGVCTLAFVANIRQGPSIGQPLLADAARPGELRGQLQFSLSDTGKLDSGRLRLPDGATLPVVGQAAGHSLQVRIELAPRWALVAVGVGEQQVAACQGAIDGVATGPDVGDLGNWHAAALRQDGDNTPGAPSVSGTPGGSSRQNRGRGTPTPGPTNSGAENTPCASGLTRCGDDCADLDSDPNHCGACGSVCPAMGGLVCEGGRCGCPSGWVDCSQAAGAPEGIDGYCADLGRDAGNCGACGAACPAGESCTGGKCRGSGAAFAQCAPGLTECDGACVDLASPSNHCDACGSVCQSGLVPVACRDGVCKRATCPPGEEYCGAVSGCRDLQTDPNHCGACQRQCAGGRCSDGRCAPEDEPCPSDQADCGEGCTDPSDNAFHCGACVDTATDPSHCGFCNNPCGGISRCVAGGCINTGAELLGAGLGCPAGFSFCSGDCVDLVSDDLNCGTCGQAGGYGMTCIGAACVAICGGQGLTFCNGECVNTLVDDQHCGGCGNAYPPGQFCNGSGNCSSGA